MTQDPFPPAQGGSAPGQVATTQGSVDPVIVVAGATAPATIFARHPTSNHYPTRSLNYTLGTSNDLYTEIKGSPGCFELQGGAVPSSASDPGSAPPVRKRVLIEVFRRETIG